MTRTKGLGLVFACAAVLATLAPAAGATVTVSSTGGVGGNIAFSGDGAGDGLHVDFFTGADFASGGLTCNQTTDPCDVISQGVGPVALAAGPNCIVLAGPQGFCPDATTLSGSLGGGNDNLRVLNNLIYTSFTLDLGDGNDSFEGTASTFTGFANVDAIQGGAGNDRLLGNLGNDVLRGGEDADEIAGLEGDDQVFGEGGDDKGLNGGSGTNLVDGGAGNDNQIGQKISSQSTALGGNNTFAGGPGVDTLSYLLMEVSPVNISLDGAANDGPGGDNVGSDIEELFGTDGADTIVGDAGAQTIRGNQGVDNLQGGGGPDIVIGGQQGDTIDPGPGADSVFGDDITCAGIFRACIQGGADTIRARDGEIDQIVCGPETDTVTADATDVTDADPVNGCENVDRPGTITRPPVVVKPPTAAAAYRACVKKSKKIKKKSARRKALRACQTIRYKACVTKAKTVKKKKAQRKALKACKKLKPRRAKRKKKRRG